MSQSSGPGLSKGEMLGLYQDIQNGSVSDAQVERIWSQIDQQTKRDAVQTALDQFVIPHLEGVKQRARDDADAATVRAQYADLDDADQQEVFNQAVSDVVAALFEIRERPAEGLLTLKGLLRDPYTVEGLLLIFDNEQHIDPDYSEQMKDFAAMHLEMVGVALAPEMYDADTVREVYDRLGLDTQRTPDAAQ